jgi:hypothetical protein
VQSVDERGQVIGRALVQHAGQAQGVDVAGEAASAIHTMES